MQVTEGKRVEYIVKLGVKLESISDSKDSYLELY